MNTDIFNEKEIWFITGSQDLYGEETLKQVAAQSRKITDGLNDAAGFPVRLVWKPVVLSSAGIVEAIRDANAADSCVGIITWMHTFSPSKMWIRGLSILNKPLLHLHTQFSRDIPWESIDMDFMNLNQSAHGDREFGHINARMNLKRRVVAGYWQDKAVQSEIGAWIRAALALDEAAHLRVARFGDNMRKVAVTEGDKVELEIALGVQVDGFGIGDLVSACEKISQNEIQQLVEEYKKLYSFSQDVLSNPDRMKAVEEQARIELGLRAFLDAGGYKAFTTTFENLYGLPQLPGLAVQRLMADGYGFGAEGDWKHAALVRIVKVMAAGLPGGTSFMEDYTYHMDPENSLVLGAHMLEICPSIAVSEKKPSLEVHPLGIGGKADPARLVFDGEGGAAINVSLVDMGDRLRLIVNEVEAHRPDKSMPKLPVARVLWKPLPDFKTGLEGWILAGGAHHTAFSTAVHAGHIADFAEMAGIELIRIGKGSSRESLKQEILLSRLAAKLG